jgi:putative endonuclease
VHYTYVLLSERDQRFYIGATKDLKDRFRQHQAGRVGSTRYRRPLVLIYYEACLDPEDSLRRERFLKSGRGGNYLKRRLASSLAVLPTDKLERH